MSSPAPEAVRRRITRYYNAPVNVPVKETPEGLEVQPDFDLVGNPGRISLIDKFGQGPEVLRLKSAGLTQDEIAAQLGFTRTQVQYWLNNYANLSQSARASKRGKWGSIFEMAERLQETFEHLMEKLEELRQGDGNSELEIKIHDKVLKAIAQAGTLVEKIELAKENQRFKDVVLELLDQEAPGIRAKALRKLSEHTSTINILRPLK